MAEQAVPAPTRCAPHAWDKVRSRCTKCGRRKTRHYFTEKREWPCGCIDTYSPGPEGWTNWLRCNRHEEFIRSEIADRRREVH